MVEPAPHVPVSTARDVLAAVLEAAALHPDRRAWVALDLDGTLFDNRPRTLTILRGYGLSMRQAAPTLLAAIHGLTLDDLHYSPTHAIEALGPQLAVHAPDFMKFWRDRFFTNAFQALDAVEAGAVEFALALCDAGLGVVYLTGRDRPGMMAGVMQSLDSHGFPLATAQTQVVLKPDFLTPDVQFKRNAIAELKRNGPVVGLFDNEPGIVNMAIDTVPDIVSVRMCRAFAPDPPLLHAKARQIKSFQL